MELIDVTIGYVYRVVIGYG